MSVRSLVAAGLWLGTLALIGLLLSGVRLKSVAPRGGDVVPSAGESIPLGALRASLGIDLPASGASLLFLSSGCRACLVLSTELDSLAKGAECSGRKLFPIIVESPSDARGAIENVLRVHGIEEYWYADSESVRSLGVGAVPSVVGIMQNGRVISVAGPGIPATWPPVPDCK